VKLLVVNWQDRLNPQAGGAEIHLHEIFGRLAGQGHEVTLLASGWAGAAAHEAVDGIEVLRTGSRYSFSFHAPRHYRHDLGNRRFHCVVDALNKVPLFTPLWVDGPIVLLVHHLFGATAFDQASLPLAAATWLLERPLARVYAHQAVQAISDSTADDLVSRGIGRTRIAVIHPGVDTQFFTPGASTTRSDPPGFLYLGRLQRYKGVDLIVQAMAVLRDNGVNCELWIAGRGEHEPALRRLTVQLGLLDRVRFLGYVSEDRKRALFRSAWANVYTSPKEGWGITNIEAAACGTPTVASAAPGLRESVRHGETGLLVPHGDVSSLASALEKLARDSSLVETLGRGARRFAEHFTWERAAAETEAHLHAAAGISQGASVCLN
jgi:glycosyltransferase involved in cell wall biosynthesis